MSDQPTTCPKCGARSDTMSNMMHTNAKMLVEECLNPNCGFVFLVEEDDDESYYAAADDDDPEGSP